MNNPRLDFIIKNAAGLLKSDIRFGDPYGILKALATVESSFGTNNVPRFEKAYSPMGIYYNSEQKERYAKWGAAACCSYSSFQIMYTTACELGFDSQPWSRNPSILSNDEVAIFYVIEYIKKRVISRGAQTVEQLFDIYNSGSLDKNIPADYIRVAMQAYNSNPNVDHIIT